jgi:phenol 2-monooxygenase
MNVSSQDGHNLGWKLAAVLKGQASPELLKTYNSERERVAADLIDFDRSFTKLFSMKVDHASGATPKYFSEQFVKSRQYIAGLSARYIDSIITSAERSEQEVAENLPVGMRFPRSQVVRFCDAREVQFAKALAADGRWRIVIFAGDLNNSTSAERLDKV